MADVQPCVELEFQRDGSEVVISARSRINDRGVGFTLRMPVDRAGTLACNAQAISGDDPSSSTLRCTLSRSTLEVLP